MAGRPKRRRSGPSVAEIKAALEKAKKAHDARAVEVRAAIEEQMDVRSRAVHRLGRALATVRAERLFMSFGDASFEAFLERIGIGRSQAWKWMKIAAVLPEDEAASLEVEEAYARAVRGPVAGRRRRTSR